MPAPENSTVRTWFAGAQAFGKLLFRDFGAVVFDMLGNRSYESQNVQFHTV
jgi:hypothetical protein